MGGDPRPSARGRAPRALVRRAKPRLPGSEQQVAPRPSHAPVRVLVRSEVMVDVPGKVAARPLRVEVRAAMLSVVLDGAPEEGRGQRGHPRRTASAGIPLSARAKTSLP